MQISNIKNQNYKSKFKILHSGLLFCILIFGFLMSCVFAQPTDSLEFNLDVNSPTRPLPKIFKPNIDLSGRGYHKDNSWPQGLAAKVALESWQQDIGFGNLYRLQYNLWEINELAKDKDAYGKLLGNYENIIKSISDAGGIVILDIFSTPAGLGKALDKKSAPWDLKAFKAMLKQTIKQLSCDKKYNIWYEVWSAPDLDDFYLGRQQEYLNLYRAVAEAASELSVEYKIYIPVGGPSTSWWFQDLEGNTIVTPERSLIYALIKFCYSRHLPLNFISWHAYSTDPKAERELTLYNKTGIGLIRDWLSYFHFDRNTPLIVDEWNYDSGINMLPERQEKSNICASYIISRLKNMFKAGLDYQVYFSLEDFQNNKEQISRNVGVFWFEKESTHKRGTKSTYNVFRMISALGKDMFISSLNSADEFVDCLATKDKDDMALLVYNYCDPAIATNYVSRNIGSLNNAERKILLNIIKSGRLQKVIQRKLDMKTIRLTNRLRGILKKAQELNEQAAKFSDTERVLKLTIKNLKEDYVYQRYTVDSSCTLNCDFAPVEEKEIKVADTYQDTLTLKPYSVNLLIFKKKPKEEPKEQEAVKTETSAPVSGAEAVKKEQPVPPPAVEAKENTTTTAPAK
jgi:hypothetical protein